MLMFQPSPLGLCYLLIIISNWIRREQLRQRRDRFIFNQNVFIKHRSLNIIVFQQYHLTLGLLIKEKQTPKNNKVPFGVAALSYLILTHKVYITSAKLRNKICCWRSLVMFGFKQEVNSSFLCESHVRDPPLSPSHSNPLPISSSCCTPGWGAVTTGRMFTRQLHVAITEIVRASPTLGFLPSDEPDSFKYLIVLILQMLNHCLVFSLLS